MPLCIHGTHAGTGGPAACTLFTQPQARQLPVPVSLASKRSKSTQTEHFCNSEGAVWSLKSQTQKASLLPSGLQAPGTQRYPPIQVPFSLQPSPPKRRELKHAITQLLDGKCFGNFRLHLLLNLILSSVAHYARDGISCGLPGTPHTSRRQPAMLLSLPSTGEAQ